MTSAVVLTIAIAFMAVLGMYLRRLETGGGVGPWFAPGILLAGVGALMADAARFAVGPAPVVATVGAVMAAVGYGMLAASTHPWWRELLCDVFLFGTCVLLLLTEVLLVLTDVQSTVTHNLDLLNLGLAIFIASLSVRFALIVPAPRPADRLLMPGHAVLRISGWTLGALQTADVVSVGSLPAILVASGYLLTGLYVLRLGMHGVRPPTPDYQIRPVTLPITIAAITTVTTLVGMSLNTEFTRPGILALAGLAVASVLIRQLSTARVLARSTQEAQTRETYYRALVQDSSDVIMIAAADGRLEYVSPASERVLGLPGDLAGEPLWGVLNVPPGSVDAALATAQRDGAARLESHLAGRVFEASVTTRADQYVVSVRDVTEREQLRLRLHHLAYHDSLTGLANRAQLLDTVDAILTDPADDAPITLLFVDLDRFKQINDASGHAVGDLVLCQVANRLRRAAEDAFIARLGGDEFVVIHRGVPDEAQDVAERIKDSLNRPFEVHGHQYQIGASTGIAQAVDGTSADELLRHADLAMYRAKRHREGWALYEQAMAEAAVSKVDTESEVSTAMGRGDLLMYLQPLVRTDTIGPVGCEALLRWVGRDGSIRPPAPLLAFANNTGQMGALTTQMLTKAVTRLAQDPTGRSVVAVNVGPTVLGNPGLLHQILGLLEAYDVAPHRLEVEITEDAMVEHESRTLTVMHALRRHGVRLVVDDFGTGFSSLSYLSRFPVDGVKIDRSFTAELGTSPAARSVVRGLVGVTGELGMRLVAEGVETADQHRWLLDLGVPYAQGYWYARPEDATGIPDITTLTSWSTALSRETTHRR